MLQQPLGQQHHENAFAAALGVPYNPALTLFDAYLCRFDACVLVRSRHLLLASIKDNEVAYQIQQPCLVEDLLQRPIQQHAG